MLSPGHTLQGARRPALLLRASREMCILAVASGVHPGFPLVVVHNREELAARPASPCQRWPGSVVCAKDLLSNGTWMGLNEKLGVFCSLTNMRHRAERALTRSPEDCLSMQCCTTAPRWDPWAPCAAWPRRGTSTASTPA